MTMVDTGERVTIRDSRRWTLQSRLLDCEMELWVAQVGDASSDEKLPVVYALDGNGTFSLAVGAARMMWQWFARERELPPIVIVGVGFSPGVFWQRRSIDFTPTRDEAWEAQAAFDQGRPVITGGGPKFLECLLTEVAPQIEKRFPADPSHRVLCGFSQSGLFTLYAMFQRPEAFRAYLAGSPSLSWDNRYLFRLEEAFSREHADLPARVFISVGGLESTVPPSGSEGRRDFIRTIQPVATTQEFAAVLASRNYPSLRLEPHVFEGETHVSVMPATLSRGLRSVLGTPVVEALRRG